jgi:hypothetical protein
MIRIFFWHIRHFYTKKSPQILASRWGVSHQEMYFRALCGVKESYDEARKSSVNSMKLPNVNVPAGYCIHMYFNIPAVAPLNFSV